MRFIKIYIFLFFTVFISNAFADNDCSSLDKLSKEYAKCLKDKVDGKLKDAGVKKKFKKFKNSKTLVEFLN